MTGRRRLALILGSLLLALSLIVLAGRAILLGTYHRAAIERLASRVAGQRITIKGPIKLAFIPDPQLIAERITIGNPQGGSVRAKILKLDLAAGPLLLGQLRATRLTLRSPTIDLPWPLPGGAYALAPPPWLASLHASVENGTIDLGTLRLTNANLSIFTGGPNAVLAVGGNAMIGTRPIHLTFDLSHTTAAAATMAASISLIAPNGQPGATMNFVGQFNDRSVLTGQITSQSTVALPGWQSTPTQLQATLHADGSVIALSHLTLQHGKGRITGTAQFHGATAALDLTVQNLNIAPLWQNANTAFAPPRINLKLHLHQARFATTMLPDLTSRLRITRQRIEILASQAPIAGGVLSLTGTASPTGQLNGPFTLAVPHLAAAISAWRQLDPTLPPWLVKAPWSHAPLTLNGQIDLSARGFRLTHLQGLIGTGPTRSDFTGAIDSHGQYRAIGLQFGHLVLGSPDWAQLIAARAPPSGHGAKLNLRLTAQHIAFSHSKTNLTGTNLLIDAAIGRSINLRVGGVTLAGAVLNAHGAFSPADGLSHAQLNIAGPNATSTILTIDPSLAATIGHAPMARQRFALGLRASGPVTAIATQWHIDLGQDRTAMAAEAHQQINLTQQTAQGSFVLRAPSAIALLAGVGVKAGLTWPGAGSVGVRIGDHLSAHQIMLDNAVVSFGASTLTARLKLALTPTPTLTGRIHAGRLALPEPARLIDGAMALMQHAVTVQFTARHIESDGTKIATDLSGDFSAGAKTVPTLSVAVKATPAMGGALTAHAKLMAQPQQKLHLALGITMKRAPIAPLTEIAQQAGIHLPFTGGTADLVTALAATGRSSAAWIKSATGSFAVTAHQTQISGINLTGAAMTLRAARAPLHRISRFTAADRLRRALAIGSTPVSTGQIAATLAAHDLTIDYAHFVGPAGAVRLSGTINRAISRLKLSARIRLSDGQQPSLPALDEQILGTATSPWHHAGLSQAMRWIDAPPPPKR
jgi:hypothetical protein